MNLFCQTGADLSSECRVAPGTPESQSDSDEDVAKVVKSAKDKRFEELEGTVKAIENGEKINDWHVISAGRFRADFTKDLS